MLERVRSVQSDARQMMMLSRFLDMPASDLRKVPQSPLQSGLVDHDILFKIFGICRDVSAKRCGMRGNISFLSWCKHRRFFLNLFTSDDLWHIFVLMFKWTHCPHRQARGY